MATYWKDLSAIDYLRTLPREWLPSSALVDFILLFGAGKPAVRVQLINPESSAALFSWCREAGLDLAIDDDAFACISVERGGARRILEIDRASEAHEIELGLALGYPSCCCTHIAAIGEADIDRYAEEVAHWCFTGPNALTNPSGYREGLALVSHIPCSVNCEPSFEIASRARQFVINHVSEPFLSSLARSRLVAGK
jgi:hypothetical protein